MAGLSRRGALALTGAALTGAAMTGAALAGAPLAAPAIAQPQQAPGVTAGELLIGQTMPYSGPASSVGTIGKVQSAYFDMINRQGGIHGRKVNLLSLDDGFSPPKTVEQTRKLVEDDGVACIFQPLGTAPALATRKYLNAKKIPQLFVGSGASQFADPDHYPWTIPYQISYASEARIYARYILSEKPGARIGLLLQNDDSGRDFLRGFNEGLGDRANQIVLNLSFEPTDPTVDSQVVQLHSAGADTLFMGGIPKFGAMTLRKVRDLAWQPLYVVATIASSVASGLAPAGLDKAAGLISGAYMKDPSDPQWADDPAFKDWLSFMRTYMPGGDLADINNVNGYCVAQLGVQTFSQCGDDLSRDNIMRQAASLDIQLPMFQPGIRFHTTATNYLGIKRLRLQRFNGTTWEAFGGLMEG